MKKKFFSVIFIVIFLLLCRIGLYLYTQFKLSQNCRQFVDDLPSTFLDFDSSVNLTFNALMKTHNCMEKQNISFLQSSEMRNKYLSAIQKTKEFLTYMHQKNIFCDLNCGTAAKTDIINDLLMFEKLAQEVLQYNKPYLYHTKFASLCSSDLSNSQTEKCMKEKILLKLQKSIKPDDFNEIKNSFDSIIILWQNFYFEVLPKKEVPEQMQGIYTLIWVTLNDMIKRHNIK